MLKNTLLRTICLSVSGVLCASSPSESFFNKKNPQSNVTENETSRSASVKLSRLTDADIKKMLANVNVNSKKTAWDFLLAVPYEKIKNIADDKLFTQEKTDVVQSKIGFLKRVKNPPISASTKQKIAFLKKIITENNVLVLSKIKDSIAKNIGLVDIINHLSNEEKEKLTNGPEFLFRNPYVQFDKKLKEKLKIILYRLTKDERFKPHENSFPAAAASAAGPSAASLKKTPPPLPPRRAPAEQPTAAEKEKGGRSPRKLADSFKQKIKGRFPPRQESGEYSFDDDEEAVIFDPLRDEKKQRDQRNQEAKRLGAELEARNKALQTAQQNLQKAGPATKAKFQREIKALTEQITHLEKRLAPLGNPS